MLLIKSHKFPIKFAQSFLLFIMEFSIESFVEGTVFERELGVLLFEVLELVVLGVTFVVGVGLAEGDMFSSPRGNKLKVIFIS